MEPKSLVLILQDPDTGHNAEPYSSSPRNPILFLKNNFYLYLGLYGRIFPSGFPTETLLFSHMVSKRDNDL
jgi:hypothetical protein